MPTCSGRCLSSEWRYRAAASMSVRRSRAGRRLAAGVRVGIARWRRAGTEPTRSPCNTPAPRTGHRLSESGHDRVEYEGLQAVSRTTRRQHDVDHPEPDRSRPFGAGVPGGCATKSLISESIYPEHGVGVQQFFTAHEDVRHQRAISGCCDHEVQMRCAHRRAPGRRQHPAHRAFVWDRVWRGCQSPKRITAIGAGEQMHARTGEAPARSRWPRAPTARRTLSRPGGVQK